MGLLPQTWISRMSVFSQAIDAESLCQLGFIVCDRKILIGVGNKYIYWLAYYQKVRKKSLLMSVFDIQKLPLWLILFFSSLFPFPSFDSDFCVDCIFTVSHYVFKRPHSKSKKKETAFSLLLKYNPQDQLWFILIDLAQITCLSLR